MSVRESNSVILVAEKARIEIVAPDFVWEALARLGRTEDVRFSPDNRKLAIAGFHQNACLILDVEVDRSASKPVVRFHDCLELRSDSLKEPHGLDFITGSQLIVANRGGCVAVFALPDHPVEGRVLHAKPVREVRKAGTKRKLNSPGSVCVRHASWLRTEILVCNNYTHRISRHIFATHLPFCPSFDSTLLNEGFQIPDGIAINHNQSWLAISNHGTCSVLMFDLKAGVRRSSEAVGRLTMEGMYPHGLRFSGDGRRIFVADAGAPFVHVYEADENGWRGSRTPRASLEVLSEEVFLKGRNNPQEGGPKGIDLTAAGDVMAVSCHQQPLNLFHLPELVS
jgi:hypothetical protein